MSSSPYRNDVPSKMPTSASASAVMSAYRATRNAQRKPVLARYEVLGYLSSGTYGRVYKAKELVANGSTTDARVFAIKKFKSDKNDDAQVLRGISQSIIREIALNRELHHENIVSLHEVLQEKTSIFLVFEYVDHDFLQIIHHHVFVLRKPIDGVVVKSLIWQLMHGIEYLHANWIMHRDLKPANILISNRGVVKIGDMGLARVYSNPLVPLYSNDMVVVTIWYRAPELLLGARHYTTGIDIWAIGCIWGELLALRPMFKGEEVRPSTQKGVRMPLQTCVYGTHIQKPTE